MLFRSRLILGVDHALASQVPAKVGHRNALVEIVRIAYLAGLDDGYAMGYEDGALSVAPNALVPGAPTAEAEG